MPKAWTSLHPRDTPVHDLNPSFRGMLNSATIAINERSDRLIAEGRTVFKLGLGQSPFPVAAPVVEALRENAHQKDYLPVRGLFELRVAISKFHRRRDSVDRDPHNVLVGPGSKELMFLAQLVFSGQLVVPSPSWVSYEPQARMLGKTATWIATECSQGWKLSAAGLDVVCESQGAMPRLLILNSPSNPTGACFDDSELAALAEVARKHHIVVLSDEIYGEVHHRGKHRSMARHYPEGTIVSSGLSKWCGAGGWRLGYMTFPSELSWLCDAMAAAASETFTSTSAPIQYAAVSAFADDPRIDRYLDNSRRVLRAVSAHCVAALEQAGAKLGKPEGGFYLFPELGGIADVLSKRGIRSSPELCSRLFDDTSVAVLPGTAFGRPANEFSLRLAHVDFDGESVLAAADAADAAEDLGSEFVRAQCPNVATAIDRMTEWFAG